jgi:hypothetical protein
MKLSDISVEKGGVAYVCSSDKGNLGRYSAGIRKKYGDREVKEILLHSVTLFIWLEDKPKTNIKKDEVNEEW